MASASPAAETAGGAGRRAERIAVAAARAGLALAVGLVVATLVLFALTSLDRVEPMPGRSHLQGGVLAVAFLAYSAVGALIVVRRPANRVGWIFLVSGLGFHVWVFAFRYAAYGLVVQPGSLPAAAVAAWASEWVGVVGFGLAFTFLLQVFPDGSLPSRRWRALLWFTGAALLVWAFTWATEPGPLSIWTMVDNPVGIAAIGRLDSSVGWGLFVLAVLASAASLIVRYVGSAGVERRQIRWFAYAATLPAAALVMITMASDDGWRLAEVAAEVLFTVGVAAVPVAAFVAMFKHDLYDLDLVVSKTITFGALAALITGVYVAVAAGIGAAAGTAGQLSLPLAVLITAVVAVAFQPVRAQVKRLANRLVYGPRATPYEVLAEFSRQMGGTLDANQALPQMARIVAQGTGASIAEVWLVVGGRVHRVVCWPPQPNRPAVPLTDGGLPPPGTSRTVEVRHRGELLGAIALEMPPGRALTRIEDRLLADVAAQAGLVLSNVRLVEEAKASRRRLVSAQDEERRRLERDIHDGVQQQLVTLALALKMTARRVTRDPPEAVTDALDAAAREAAETLAELRRLARGIHPAVVTEGGLAAALESLAERVPLPVQVRSLPTERLPATVEITVYYLVAEALTNTAKHAAASAVTVELERADGRLIVVVADNGVGGAVASPGSGLAGLADRVAALGGGLEIDSPAEGGTQLRAEIPCASS